MDSFYSYWEKILSGLQQSSILDPLLFNMYISDIYFSRAAEGIESRNRALAEM